MKRRGSVLFDITGEFTEFIEQRLIWAKRELGKEVESNSQREIWRETLRKEVDILSKVLTTTVKALDTIMWYQWEADMKEKDRWKSIHLKVL